MCAAANLHAIQTSRELAPPLGSFCWILLGFEEEGVTGEGNGWRHWKEEKTLGGGAHQGQSGWSKTTGATDF
ncbi:hypothetical protein BY996DRAFT_6530290 [Phakopsora pachyrhizi]|nr:hypothetical protein BY996DRAFT_6530290 [Phakopsora pachyrhizi]